MKFPVISTAGHQGKTLVIDPDLEMVIVQSTAGTVLGNIPWGAVIERALEDHEQEFEQCRAYPRASLAVKVHCSTPDGQEFDSLTGGIGGGGLFIESSSPLALGSELVVEFALPDHPLEKLKAKAKVVWVRNKPERYLLFPGMGIQFVEIEKTAQDQLVELVTAMNRSRNHHRL